MTWVVGRMAHGRRNDGFGTGEDGSEICFWILFWPFYLLWYIIKGIGIALEQTFNPQPGNSYGDVDTFFAWVGYLLVVWPFHLLWMPFKWIRSKIGDKLRFYCCHEVIYDSEFEGHETGCTCCNKPFD